MKLHIIYAFLRFGCLPLGALLLYFSLNTILQNNQIGIIGEFFLVLLIVVEVVLGGVGIFILYNVYVSPNRSWINPLLKLETWHVTNDRWHNSNTDLTWFKGRFYLAHAASPFHFASEKCRIWIKSSIDCKTWEIVTSFEAKQEDIRDPKFAIIGNRLFLYVLLNRSLQPLPYTTFYSYTDDGKEWRTLTPLEHEGWLFWRPKSHDGRVWYTPAYWYQFNENVLFRTSDGIDFERVATIQSGRYISEPEIEFLPNKALLAVGRADYNKQDFQQIIGIRQSSTIISIAECPYTTWKECAEDQTTRLDGCVMFSYHGRLYAIGRSHPYYGAVFPQRGAVLGKKRTAIYEVLPTGLRYLSDLPSAGDTGYAGVVLQEEKAYISYYTSNFRHDPLWLFGMMEPSQIQIACLELTSLEKIAGEQQ